MNETTRSTFAGSNRRTDRPIAGAQPEWTRIAGQDQDLGSHSVRENREAVMSVPTLATPSERFVRGREDRVPFRRSVAQEHQ
jgi:hypothetical protein